MKKGGREERREERKERGRMRCNKELSLSLTLKYTNTVTGEKSLLLTLVHSINTCFASCFVI